MIKLFVALGNPGKEYAETRHNIGWQAFEYLSFVRDVHWQSKFKGKYTKRNTTNGNVYFLMPHTFMNLSGESVQELTRFFQISPEEVLVVHDELDLPHGEIQFKKGGGLAGHNGLKSIAQHLGTQEFFRIRLGIGHPNNRHGAKYVLSKYSTEQMKTIVHYLESAAQSIEAVMSEGFEKAAGKFSKQNFAI